MKKLALLILLSLSLSLSLSPLAHATREGIDAFQSTDFTSVTTGPIVTLKGSGVMWHKLSWTTNGTVSTCQVQADGAVDGVTFGTTVIASTLCTSAGFVYIAIPIEINFLRINMTVLTGGGTVTVTYTGYISPSYGGLGVGVPGGAVPQGAMYVAGNGGGASGTLTPVAVGTSSVNINMSTAVTTQMVPLTSGQSIRVTHIDFQSAGTTNVSIVYGTGANCGTGTTTIYGPYTLTAGGAISIGSGFGQAIVIPVSQALCITNSAAIQIGGGLTASKY